MERGTQNVERGTGNRERESGTSVKRCPTEKKKGICRENARRSGILLFPDRPRFWDVTKTGNGELGKWNVIRGRGTGNRERESGTSVKRCPPENSTWWRKEKKREQFGKCEEVFLRL